MALHGQLPENQLAGTWKADRYIRGTDTIPFNGYWDTYHFLPTGEFKMLQSNLVENQENDTAIHFLQMGKYSLDDSILKFYHVKEFEISDGYFLVEKRNKIVSLNDSLLRFEIILGDTIVYNVDYKRISEKEWEYAFQNINGIWSMPADDFLPPTIYLMNSLHPEKRKKINGYHSLTFSFVRPSTLSDSTFENIEWIGMIAAINDTVLSFRVYDEKITWYNEVTDINITNSTEYSMVAPPVKTAPVQNAEITYSAPGVEMVNSISSGVFSFSLVSGLIIAPLASIQYRQGGFNEKRYFNIAGYSMSTALLMVPIMFATFEKTFHITTRKGPVSKWKWLIAYGGPI